MAHNPKPKSRGSRPDKLMRDALLLELKRDGEDADGKKTKKIRLVARRLVDKAIEGDVPAIREINDRIDGKVPQAVVGDSDFDPVQVNVTGIDGVVL